jgi:hypothetical protein
MLSRIFGRKASAGRRGPVSAVSRLFGGGAGRPPARHRSARLGLEQLDQRVLPSITPLGYPTDVTGQVFGNQHVSSTRTVARDANGNYAVTWQDTDYYHGGIFVRLFNAGGTALTAPIHVQGTSGGLGTRSDGRPSIAMNAQGEFAVAWVHVEEYNGVVDIYVQRFNASGFPVEFPRAVANSPRDELDPSVALDNSGNLMVAYSVDSGYGDHDVLVWHQSATGATGLTAVAGSYADETAPSLALNANGQGVVAFVTNFDFSGRRDIYAVRIDSSGALLGGYIPMTNYTFAFTRLEPSVASNSFGSFVISYTEQTSSSLSPYQVFASRFNASGTFLGRVSVGDSWDTRAEFSSSVSLDDFGRFVVAYTHAWSSTDRDVRAQAFDDSGAALGGWVWVSGSGAYDELSPSVALGNLDGQLIVGFETRGLKQDGSGRPGSGVSAARFTLNSIWIAGTFNG